MEGRDTFWFYVNGKRVLDHTADPETTLLIYLRQKLHLTGTKNACNQGGCGACTIMVSWYDDVACQIRHKTVNACITPLYSVYGYAVTTVEGIGNSKTGLHPIQESLVQHHGIQCGFCTPGMVVSLFCLLRNKNKPSLEDVEKTLEGNLCRCTGYRPILDSAKPFTNACPLGEKCCKIQDGVINEEVTPEENNCVPADPTQNVIFPPELMNVTKERKIVTLSTAGRKWLIPFTVKELLEVRQQNPEAKVVMGATNLSYFMHMGKLGTKVLIDCCRIPEFLELSVVQGTLEIGAAVTMTTLETFLTGLNGKYHAVPAILDCLRWIAAGQIRNAATIGGHIVTADKRSDLNPLLVSLGASVEVVSNGGRRHIILDEKFFLGNYKTCLESEDIVVKIIIPSIAQEDHHIQFYKQSQRKGFDYAIVNMAFNVRMSSSGIMDNVFLYVGNIKDSPTLLKKTSEYLVNKTVQEIDQLCLEQTVSEEVLTHCDDGYKRALVQGFTKKFVHTLSQRNIENCDKNENEWMTPCISTQVIEEVPKQQPDIDSVGRPLPQVTSHILVSGEAQFIDDIPPFKDELYLCPVFSRKAHANIISIDATKALEVPGVVGFYDHTSIIGQNKFGLIFPDEELFASHTVHSYGQLIGVVAAESTDIARKASHLVSVAYEELEPVLTIEDAIRKNSFFEFDDACNKHKGNVDTAMEASPIVLEGDVSTGSQEHFYMETMGAIAFPHEDGEMEVKMTHQNSMFQQAAIASLLDVTRNRVTIKHRRTGGAFGGKETMPYKVGGPAALVAKITGRPVRFVLDRYDDMNMSGKRHPFHIKYKAGVDTDGNIRAVDFNLYADAGFSNDMSIAVLEFSIHHVDGCYNIPNFRVKGHLCRTNTTTNTGFRGFGAPQAVIGIESMMSHIAHALGKSLDQIQYQHLYKINDTVICGSVLQNCNIDKCWKLCEKQSNFGKLKEEVSAFNRDHHTRKRGVAMMPLKFPVGYPLAFLNQGTAMITVYLDGSVLLTHGGCEMGQGLNTKMIQVASKCLGIPVKKIYTNNNNTDVIPNATPTSASSTSDIIGRAVVNACTELLGRLKPLREEKPDRSWEDLINSAYLNRVNLSVTGYGAPGDTPVEGNPGYLYFTYGAGCSLVEIDCLTGDHQVLSTDIVMDVGKSLNPAIDIGQIEGGFIQGYGMMTMEDLRWNSEGVQLANGPINYKIPGVRNIPRKFRVSLLKDCPNLKAVYSSKGIGEPPLLLATTVYLALKAAITTARSSHGYLGHFRLDCPLTAEKICMACLKHD